MNKRTIAQRERQDHRKGDGRYTKFNPCQRCGKSAGTNYCSYLCDDSDTLGNRWGDRALCLCKACAAYMEETGIKNAEAAWAETNREGWGKLPQGKAGK